MKTFRIRSVPLRNAPPAASAASSANSPDGGGGGSDDTSDVPAAAEQAADVEGEGEGAFAGVPLYLWILGAALLWARR